MIDSGIDSAEEESRQVNFRLPDSLATKIKLAAATAPGYRSATTEIVARLEASFAPQVKPVEPSVDFPTPAQLMNEYEPTKAEIFLLEELLDDLKRMLKPTVMEGDAVAHDMPHKSDKAYLPLGVQLRAESTLTNWVLCKLCSALEPSGWGIRPMSQYVQGKDAEGKLQLTRAPVQLALYPLTFN